ncbi:MAG: hypothetical protein RJA07_376 [Bacteroidota bacterium]|jgi:vacuolar-type H+-ATPase subunit F/Vma7
MASTNKNKEAIGIGRKSKKDSSLTTIGEVSDVSTAPTIPPDLTPYTIFLRCIKRAENLINFHSSDANPNEEHFCDAYRASIVLTIAALDAYARTVAIIKIKERIANKLKAKDPLRAYLKKIMTHDCLLESSLNDSFISEIEIQISNDFHQKSFQGDEKITEYFTLAGLSNIIGAVAAKQNKNEKTLKEEINKYTKRRHTIAHNGDYATNQVPYKELEIQKEFAENCHKLISEFTKTLNEICFKK